MFELTVLIDNNRFSLNRKLLFEHGFSVYFKIDGFFWLYDVGASDKWFYNAKALGINIEDVDYLILSHGHGDHTGGLPTFLSVNTQGMVFASDKCFGYQYFTYRHGNSRNISSDVLLQQKHANRFIFLPYDDVLSPHVFLVYNKVYDYSFPVGNHFLTVIDNGIEKSYVPDDEVSLAIRVYGGIVVISGCSHSGILNIIQSCVEATGCSCVIAFIGGTHLVDTKGPVKDDVEDIARNIMLKYPQMLLYAGHCTGKTAINIFSEILQDKFVLLGSGLHLKF